MPTELGGAAQHISDLLRPNWCSIKGFPAHANIYFFALARLRFPACDGDAIAELDRSTGVSVLGVSIETRGFSCVWGDALGAELL